eukprot:363431-Chlamydomonas_euryale.AAC.1
MQKRPRESSAGEAKVSADEIKSSVHKVKVGADEIKSSADEIRAVQMKLMRNTEWRPPCGCGNMPAVFQPLKIGHGWCRSSDHKKPRRRLTH